MVTSVAYSSLLFLLSTYHFLRRKKPGIKEPLSKRPKVSPATVPPTPGAPIPSPIHDANEVERTGNQFGAVPETIPMTEAMAKDVVQGDKRSGLFHGPKVDLVKGNSAGSLHSPEIQSLVSAYLVQSRHSKYFTRSVI
jgi:hypothetical protein